LLLRDGRGFQPAAVEYHASKAFYCKQPTAKDIRRFSLTLRSKWRDSIERLATEIADNVQPNLAHRSKGFPACNPKAS
jgi:hypothetical protein